MREGEGWAGQGPENTRGGWCQRERSQAGTVLGFQGTGANRQTFTLPQPSPSLSPPFQGTRLAACQSCLVKAAYWQPWKRPRLPAGLGAAVEVGLGAGFPVARLPGLWEPCKPPPASRPEVLPVVEVPGGRVAHHLPPVAWLLQHGFCPEFGWHGQEPQGGEELLCHPEHVCGVPALGVEGWGGTLGSGASCWSPPRLPRGHVWGPPLRSVPCSQTAPLLRSLPSQRPGPYWLLDKQKWPAAHCPPPLPAGS